MSQALGMLESKGMVGLAAATDAMAKAAGVTIVKRMEIGGGFVTTLVQGDVGNVRAAVDAGAASLNALGASVVAAHVIPQPHAGLVNTFVK